jgi:Dehydrogenases with different specificities (related to short-chain alcohol dehydrogenases)
MLANKIALVTGSSKGIGAGIALELAKSGADICVNYCGSPTSAEDVVNQIRSVGRRAIAIQADVHSATKWKGWSIRASKNWVKSIF